MTLLDNPIWSALTTRQVNLAEANELACRFPPDITTLAGIIEPARESYDALASLARAGEEAVLFVESVPESTPGWQMVETSPLLQMVHTGAETASAQVQYEVLNVEDLAQMLALTEVTKPGPFGNRTPQLGTFIGIRHEGRLVAMTGERLHLPGYTEVSAVCTHNEYQGKGYASALIQVMVQLIKARHETPFLHVLPQNTRAVAVYERLGFTVRRTFSLVVLLRE